ncbi:MAG: tetratricopeptide repeat protein [Nitrospirae bacterium]|nr:tetratricopeptide repeat protein [Nitrospirota bacterium]
MNLYKTMKIYKLYRLLLLVLPVLLCLATEAVALNIADVLSTEELKKAWVLLEMKEYKSATDMLNGCYDSSKGQPDLLASCNFIYAKILERQDVTAKAIDRYRKAYQYATNDKVKEEALIRRSELNLLKNFNNDAKTGFQTFIKDYPNSKQIDKAYLGLAKSLLGLEKPAEALEVFNKAGTNNSEVLFEKANTLQRLGKVAEARDAYMAAMRKEPGYMRKNNDETLYYYGENTLASGDVKGARGAFSSIHDARFQDRATLGLAKTAIQESKLDMATAFLNKVINSKDKDIRQDALLCLSRIQLKSGKTEEAKSGLKTLKAMGLKEKDKGEVTSIQIDLDVKDKKYTDAANSIKKLYAKEPDSKDMLDKIEGVMSEAMKGDNKQFVDLWVTYGTTLLTKSREPFILRAKDALKDTGKPYVDVLTWISKNSSDTERHKALGELTEIYSDSGDKASAVKYLAELKNLKAPGDNVLRAEARMDFNNRDYNEALKSAILIKQLGKEDIDIIRSSILMAPKNETAVLFYEKAIKELGGTTDDYMAIADAFYALGNAEGANSYYKKVLALEPANEWAAYRLGAALSSRESEAILAELSKGTSPISRFSKAALKEAQINKRIAGGKL